MMSDIFSALQFATRNIAQLDAEVLLAYVIAKPRSTLYSSPEKKLTDDEWQHYLACVNRRMNKEPIAYIVGKKEFWSLDLNVNKNTLVPRSETELLVETILDLFDETSSLHIADIGTGSGAIALALAKERPHWHIFASDISEDALCVARLNAKNHGINNASFHEGHLLTAIPQHQLDVIVSNPPYLAETEWQERISDLQYEPKQAFVFGCLHRERYAHSMLGNDRLKTARDFPDDGLYAIRELALSAKSYLKTGGLLIMEHGFLQGPLVRDIFSGEEYFNVRTLRDFAQLERITYGQLK